MPYIRYLFIYVSLPEPRSLKKGTLFLQLYIAKCYHSASHMAKAENNLIKE